MSTSEIAESTPEPEPDALLRELMAQPAASRAGWVARRERYWRPELAGLLTAASEDQVFRDPTDALGLARLAVAVCERLDGQDGRRDELAVASQLQMANALRVRGELEAAEQVLAAVVERWAKLDPPAALEARRLELEASLYTDQRRFPEALQRIEDALLRHRQGCNHDRECRALIQKGHILLSLETRPASAVRAFREALPLLDPDEDLRLVVICIHNLILGLNRLGYAIAARSLLEDVKALHRRLDDEVNYLKLRWLEGQLDLEISKLEAAQEAYLEARQGFLELDLPYHAALVSLDLAELYLQQSRAYKLRQLAVEMFPVFQSRRIHREALAALIVFREAVAVQTVDLRLIQEVARFLKQSRHDPRLRFRPPV